MAKDTVHTMNKHVSTKSSKYQDLAKLADRFFLTSITMQVVLVLVITIGFGFLAHRYSVGQTTAQVKKSFYDWEKRITEAVYVEEILNPSPSLKIGQVIAFEKSLRDLGIPATARVVQCDGSTGSPLVFPLSVGSKSLSSCIAIDIETKLIFENMHWIIIAGFLSIVIASLTWLLIRKWMNNEVLAPLISGIEEKSRRASLGEVATHVAHDIRSPLTVLRSIVGNLKGLPEERRSLVLGAVAQIDGIANDLIEEYRYLRDGLEVPRKSFEIVALSEQIKRIVEEKHEEFGGNTTVGLHFSADSNEIELKARIRPLEFSRVLSNLINNSVNACEPSGKVTIKLFSKGDFAVIEVRDNGGGIPPELLPQLGNEPIEYKNQKRSAGLGIGLYYAKRAIEALGGNLQIQSAVGHGTCVEITIPVLADAMASVEDFDQGVADVRVTSEIRLDAALIDDDSYIRKLWSFRARDVNKKVKTFESLSAFLKDHVPFETPVFIDRNLTNGESGLKVAQRLHDLGYMNLHLATGEFFPDATALPPFIRSVRGKDFPEYA